MPEREHPSKPNAMDMVNSVLSGKHPKIELPKFDKVTMRAAFGFKTYSDGHNKLTSHLFDSGYDAQCANGAQISDTRALIRAIERGIPGRDNNPTVSTFSFEGTNPLAAACKKAKSRQTP